MVDTRDNPSTAPTQGQPHGQLVREFARMLDEGLAAAGLGDGPITEAQREQVGSIVAGLLELKLAANAHGVLGHAFALIREARRSAPPSETKEPG